jgi:hypothetical protein
MTKYAALQNYLAGLPYGTHSKTMTFEQVENIIRSKLPPSAHKHRPWWANDETHWHAKSWMNAGWKVDTVDQSAQWVRFIKSPDVETRRPLKV